MTSASKTTLLRRGTQIVACDFWRKSEGGEAIMLRKLPPRENTLLGVPRRTMGCLSKITEILFVSSKRIS